MSPNNIPITINGTSYLANGTQVTTIAFAPQDRTSFLAKDIVGVRIIDRLSTNAASGCQVNSADTRIDTCARGITDFTVGQDADITGGYMRHLVFKTNFVYPIRKAGGLYIFGSAAIRMEHNKDSNPLILTQTTIATSAGSATPGQVTIPSSSIFVLPLRQSDRDFYRIGIGVDLASILPKLFSSK
jgi:hypothetical protein